MPPDTTPAPLWRRLVAALYDTLLLLGIWLAAIFIAWIVVRIFGNGFLAPSFVRAYLFSLSFFFFGWFWTHGGQTLGMRAWRLRVCRADNSSVNWPIAMLRFGIAIFSWLAAGLGMIWCLFDVRSRSWHDLVAGTEVIVLPKPGA